MAIMSTALSSSPLFDDELEREKEYWLSRLSGIEVVTGAPLDYRRSASKRVQRARVAFELGEELAGRMLTASRGKQTLLFAILVGAVKAALHKQTGSEDITVGTTIHESRRIIAPLNRVLVLRDRVSPNLTVKEFLDQVRQNLSDAYLNQKLPFGRILKLLGIKRTCYRAPLFDVAVLLKTINDEANLEGLANDVTLVFATNDGGLRCVADYNSKLFRSTTIDRFVSDCRALLTEMLNHPEAPLGQLTAPYNLVESCLEVNDAVRFADSLVFPPLDRAASKPLSPLSLGQRALSKPGAAGAGHTVRVMIRLTGELDLSGLEHSLAELCARHQTLRSRIVETGTEVLQYASPAVPTLTIVDLTGLQSEPVIANESTSINAMLANGGLDPRIGPPVRFILLRLSQNEHVLVMVAHRLVFDAASALVLCGELADLYSLIAAGQRPRLPELAIEYSDFVSWQARVWQGAFFDSYLRYWKTQLSEARLTTYFGFNRHGLGAGFRPARCPIELPPPTIAKLKEFGRRKRANLFGALLAGFTALLHLYTGARDLIIGVPVSNRNQKELDRLIGLFESLLLVRTRTSDDSGFEELLRQVNRVVAVSGAYQDVPLERVANVLWLERESTRNPLINVLFALREQLPSFEAGGLTIKLEEIDAQFARFDLMMDLRESDGRVTGFLRYNAETFGPDSAARLADHFIELLARVAEDPEQRLIDLQFSKNREFITAVPGLARDEAEQFDFPGQEGIL
jgi:non-ribosomal peptide synthetase component F